MGYRSDVAIAFTKTANEDFKEKIRNLPEQQRRLVVDLIGYGDNYYHKETGACLYYWESIKWYPEMLEIDFVDDFVNSLFQDEYLMFNIGEALDDIEVKGQFYDNPFNLELKRIIHFTDEGCVHHG